MLELYRGLIDILIYQSRGMDEQFTQHIRSFNEGDNDPENFGVSGFWNFLLEIICVMFVRAFLVVGVLLFVSLALVFFPLYAIRAGAMGVINHRAEPFDINEPISKESLDGNKKEK